MYLSGFKFVVWIHYFFLFSFINDVHVILYFRMSKRKYKLYLEPNNTTKIPRSRLTRRHLDVSQCATPLWYITCFIILNIIPDYVLLPWKIVETPLYILKSTSGFGFHWWPQQWRGQNQSSPEPCRFWGEMVKYSYICGEKLFDTGPYYI